ncbi:MAG: YDG domain-containing protein, partial [Gracilibacteraceae bacterium]|nr:YDG domain-containing protein [Gracilibacteraceae bacterium]
MKQTQGLLIILVALVLLLTLVPAGGALAAVPLQSISLNQTSLNLGTGRTFALNVIYDPDNTTDDITAIWTSSDSNVATVTDGEVRAGHITGVATITAAVGDKTADCLVTVIRSASGGGGPNDITDDFIDANFLAAVREMTGIPSDPIYDSDVMDITSLDVSGRNIASLAGIEHFFMLETLWCDGNQLTDLDVSNNMGLYYLNCGDNQLSTLDVGNNSGLRMLYCANNQLTALDVSNNPLEHLFCSGNKLTELDVSNNPALEYLYIDYNYLPSRSAITGLSDTAVNTDESVTDGNGDPYFLYTPQNTGGSGSPISFTLTQAGAVYGGQLANPQVRGANSANIDYSYSGTLRDGVVAYGPTAVKPSEAGDYTVAGVDRTTGAAASVSFTIAPKALTLTGLSVETKTYNGTTAAKLAGTPVLTGKVGADDVSVDLSGAAAVFDNAAAGANKNVNVTGLTLTG